jgi:CBS domain-containing protein
MPREHNPTPVENTSSKPYRIYADMFGDPSSQSHRPVTEAMSPVTVCVTVATALGEVRSLLERQRLPGVPVVGPDEELVGVVSLCDALKESPERRAGEVMAHPLALPHWTPIGKAAAIMWSERVELAPIVDSNRRIQGLLSALDLVRWLAQKDGYVLVRPR